MTSFDENYYCSGTNCKPTKIPNGQGFCAMTPFWCEWKTGLGGLGPNGLPTSEPTKMKPTKNCCSSGCEPVSMDYNPMGTSDRCTVNRLTCLYACKHNNDSAGFRFCKTPTDSQSTGMNSNNGNSI